MSKPGKPVCMAFIAGRCRFGNRCRYSHEQNHSTPITADRYVPKTRDDFDQWRSDVPKSSNARDLGTKLSAFFAQALALVVGDEGKRQGVITALAKDGGLTRIRELTNNVEICEDSSAEVKEDTFSRQVVPLLKLLSHEEVISSPLLEHDLGTIFNFLFGFSGKRSVVLFRFCTTQIENIFKHGSSHGDNSIQRDGNLALEACCVVLSHIIDLNGNAQIIEEFQPLVVRLSEAFANATENERGGQAYRTKFVLTRMKLRMNIGQEITQVFADPEKIVNKPTFNLHRDGPGDLSSAGPRHDNDFEDIRSIQILPTASEINSHRLDYLPDIDPSTWHKQGPDGLLDRQFRLLREDTVGQLRDAVRDEIERDAHHGPEQSTTKHKQAALRHVYKGAFLKNFEVQEKKGLVMVYRFYQPQMVRKMSVKDREAWWRASRRLQEGALVCLLNSNGSTTFCSIADNGMHPIDKMNYKDKSKSDTTLGSKMNVYENPDIAHIGLTLVETTSSSVDTLLSDYLSDMDSGEQKIIEFPGIVIQSFYRTLQALQYRTGKNDLPFPDLWNSRLTEADQGVKAPYYATPQGFNYDLTSLLNDRSGLTFNVSQPFDVEKLQEKSTLDEAQATSLVSTLRREVALIQGPPGTGKSFTGVAIIKVLLANAAKANLGPIICVCYTNHALDQLLEHLLDHGIDQIIRIGSQSKSERLEKLNLNHITKNATKTKTEKSALHGTYNSLKSQVHDVNEFCSKYSSAGQTGTIRQHLLMKHHRRYLELFGGGPVDEEGFQIAHSKSVDPLKRWLRGQAVNGDHDTQMTRSLEDLEGVALHAMSNEERKQIFTSWKAEYQTHAREKLLSKMDEFIETKSRKDDVHHELDLRCLRQANIVGVTTSGLARVQKMLERLNSKVLLCEEAGEILEAHTLATLLPTIQHMILIGDHQQLRPQINNYDLQKVNPRGEQYSLDVSLFERLIEPNEPSAFRVPFETLTTQRRMHPSISRLIRINSYPALLDDRSVKQYPQVMGMKRRLFWFNHEQPEANNEKDLLMSKSHTNDYEVTMTCALVEHIVKQGKYAKSDVAVLTPYLGQMRKLRQGLSRSFAIALNERDQEEARAKGIDLDIPGQLHVVAKRSLVDAIRISTVDNFQGEEAKIVVISLVRCNERNKCGFLSTANRINVLLSRAQHGMYLIGNAETYRQVPYWNSVISLLEESFNKGNSFELECPRHTEKVIKVSSPDDFVVFAPEGGCDEMCDKRLGCGHSCITKCHSDAMHNAVRCLEPCQRQIKKCQDHPCPNVCGDPCPIKCKVKVSGVSLPCGHVRTLECWEAQDTSTAYCREKVDCFSSSCGHTIEVLCSQLRDKKDIKCRSPCGFNLPCGHQCKNACHICIEKGQDGQKNHGACKQICGRPYKLCNHYCTSKCHGTEDCDLCTARCERRCTHSACGKICHEPCAPCAEEKCSAACPHSSCEMPCSVPCNWLPCSKRCEKKLKCGHRCPSLCGEPCPAPKFCQVCCTDDIKNFQVDYIELKTFTEVDLDEDPCIIPRCGHILTRDNMDGHFNMTKYYKFDSENNITEIIEASVPFSIQNDLKSCPTCRGSLREVSRYGRIVRRALLDESTKRLITFAHKRYLYMESTFQEFEITLRETQAHPLNSSLKLEGTPKNQIEILYNNKAFRANHDEVIRFRRTVNDFLKSVDEQEQPYRKVFNMVQDHRRRKGVEVRHIPNDVTTVQMRHALLFSVLLLRVDMFLLSTAVASFRASKNNPRGISYEIELDFVQNRQACSELIARARDANYPDHEIDGHVLFASYAALEAFTVGANRNFISTSQKTNLPTVEELRIEGLSHIQEAEFLCAIHPDQVKGRAEEVQNMKDSLQKTEFFAAVTSEERRQVLKAMQGEFSGTGHWYTCANGHPFSVGECGRPMEQTICPQCGSPVGGQHHENAQGVNRAEDLDRDIADMERDVRNMHLGH